MRWMWIDQITEHVPLKSLTAIKVVSLSEDYIHNEFNDNSCDISPHIMPAPLIIEGCAQAGGLLVGSVNNFTENVLLAKVRKAVFLKEVYAGETIRYNAKIETLHDEGAAIKAFIDKRSPSLNHWSEVGEASIVFSYANKETSKDLPSSNFVFDNNFGSMLLSLKKDMKESTTP